MTEMTCVCLGEGMVEISDRPGALTVRYGGDVMNALSISPVSASPFVSSPRSATPSPATLFAMKARLRREIKS